MTPAYTAHIPVPPENRHALRAVLQTESVEAGAPHRHRRVMQADEHVPRGVLLERAIERRKALRAEPAFAVRRVAEPGIEQHDDPAPERETAADLEGRM